MSPRSKSVNDIRAALMAYPCEDCGVASGERCVTESGAPAPFVHGNRWWQWKRDDRDAEDQR